MIKNIAIYKDTPREVILLFICKIVTSMGNFIFPLLSLYLTIKLEINNFHAGVILTIISLLYIPGTLLGGKLGDSYNKKTLIIFLQIFSAFFLFFTVFIPESLLKIVFIGFSSFFLTLTQPILDSFISDFALNENQRRNSYSLIYLAFNLGNAIGVFLGGKFFNTHLNLLFFFDALTTVISSLMILFFVKERALLKENKKSEKINFVIFYKENKSLLIFSLLGSIYFFVYFQINFSFPIFLSHIFLENGPNFYGNMMALNSIIVILIAPLITEFFKKFSTLSNIILSGFLFSIGFGLNFFAKSFFQIILFSLIWTIGEVIFFTNYMPYIVEKTNPFQRTRQIAISTTILRIGYYFNPIISGKLLSIITIRQQWLVIFGTMIIGTCAMFLFNYLEKNKI